MRTTAVSVCSIRYPGTVLYGVGPPHCTKAEKTARRLGLTVDEYIEGRFLPKMYARLERRYTDLRRKYKNVVVVDENDPRPIQEQIKEIFGDGPEPKFRNPEFDKK